MIDELKASERTVTVTVAKVATLLSFYKATTAAGCAITRDLATRQRLNDVVYRLRVTSDGSSVTSRNERRKVSGDIWCVCA